MEFEIICCSLRSACILNRVCKILRKYDMGEGLCTWEKGYLSSIHQLILNSLIYIVIFTNYNHMFLINVHFSHRQHLTFIIVQCSDILRIFYLQGVKLNTGALYALLNTANDIYRMLILI